MEDVKSGNSVQKSWRNLSQAKPKKFSQFLSDEEMEQLTEEESERKFNEVIAQYERIKLNSSI